MKRTLLQLVQDILSSMDSDEVNSINDTVEATQVANIVRTVYNDIISRANLPEHYKLFELDASLDPTKPTLMIRPESVQSLLWIKYDCREAGDTNSDFRMVQFKEPLEFIDHCMSYQGGTNIVRYQINGPNSSSIDIVGMNDKAPQYYTSWDDRYIIFDSYDASVDNTLMKNKTMAYGEFEPTFTMLDSFVPDLDSRQFSLLFNEAKATAFAELKQIENSRAERSAKRAWSTLAHQKSTVPTQYPFFNTLPDYGRKRR